MITAVVLRAFRPDDQKQVKELILSGLERTSDL